MNEQKHTNPKVLLFLKVTTIIGSFIVLYYQWSWISLPENLKKFISYGDIISTYSPLFVISLIFSFGGIIGWIANLIEKQKD